MELFIGILAALVLIGAMMFGGIGGFTIILVLAMVALGVSLLWRNRHRMGRPHVH